MRILNNTINDFLIMHDKLIGKENKNKLNNDKLFALCLYKNLFPYDYAKLENKKGLIPLIIDMKVLLNKCNESTDNQIAKINEDLKKLEKEHLHSFEELKLMFIGELTKLEIDGSYYNNTAINPYDLKSFENLEFRNLMHPNKRGLIRLPNYPNEILTINGNRYFDREIILKTQRDNGVEKLNNELNNLEKVKKETITWTFTEIVAENGVDFCFSEGIKDTYKNVNKLSNDLQIDIQIDYLKFLVAQNYIDEHYMQYTSIYKSNLLTIVDFELVKAMQRNECNFEAVAESFDQFVRWLDDNDFSKKSILTRQILDNIEKIKTNSQSEQSTKFNKLIELLCTKDDDAIEEVIANYLRSSDQDNFICLLKNLVSERKTLCKEIISSMNFSRKLKDLLIEVVVKNVENYSELNIDNALVEYVNSNINYSNIFENVNDIDKVKTFLTDLSIVFEKLNFLFDNNLQQFIIENNHFSINLENVNTILSDKIKDNEDIYNKNYDTIMNSKLSSLICYVSENINSYANNVLLNKKVNFIKEPKERIFELLNNTNIELNTRKAIIKKCSVQFDDISDFHKELFTTLLTFNVVNPTWSNILYSYDVNGFDSLKSYFSDFSVMPTGKYDLDDKCSLNFLNDILQFLSVDEISKIANALPIVVNIEDLSNEAINDENLSVFCEKGRVKYDTNALKYLYCKQNSLNAYIKKYTSRIKNDFDAFFSICLPIAQKQRNCYNRIEYIIKYSAQDNATKIIAAILNCKNIASTLKNDLFDKTCEIICIKDYEQIFANFVIKEKKSVPSKLLWQFTNASNFTSKKERLNLLDVSINNINIETDLDKLKAYINTLSEDWCKLNTCKVIHIPENSLNSSVLSGLKNKKFITYDKVKKNSYNEYIVKVV